MVVMKLEVNESSANRSSMQLLPTPARRAAARHGAVGQSGRLARAPSAAASGTRPARWCGAPDELTAVPDEQQLDEVVIILSVLGHRARAGLRDAVPKAPSPSGLG